MLREQYRCPHFRILVIGRANAGKTTILEKVCGVAKGTQPIIIYNEAGKLDEIPCTFSYSVPPRWRSEAFWNSYDTINWGESMIYYGYTLIAQVESSERNTWYWASDYIWRKQLYLPWLTRLWVWCEGGDRDCLELHWKEAGCIQAGESVACNLVLQNLFFT